MFAELRRAIPRPPRRLRHCQAWISPDTWSLINARIEARQQKEQQSFQVLGCEIKVWLREDRHRQSAKAGSTVEFLLASDPPLI